MGIRVNEDPQVDQNVVRREFLEERFSPCTGGLGVHSAFAVVRNDSVGMRDVELVEIGTQEFDAGRGEEGREKFVQERHVAPGQSSHESGGLGRLHLVHG